MSHPVILSWPYVGQGDVVNNVKAVQPFGHRIGRVYVPIPDNVPVTSYHPGILYLILTGHNIRRQVVDEAIDQESVLHGLFYLPAENTRRHDWHRGSGDCLYSFDNNAGFVKICVELLLCQFTPVQYALWQYWGERTRLREAHDTRHVNDAPSGHDILFRAMLCHKLEDAHWLQLGDLHDVSRIDPEADGV